MIANCEDKKKRVKFDFFKAFLTAWGNHCVMFLKERNTFMQNSRKGPAHVMMMSSCHVEFAEGLKP